MASQSGKQAVKVIGWALLMLAITSVAMLAMWKVPEWFRLSSELGPQERFKVENEILKTLAQVLGGIFLLVGFYFTWRRIGAAEKAAMAAEQRQQTERLAYAMESLEESKSITQRLGGIYALERIARYSWDDYWPIMEVLTAYVRERSPWQESESPEAEPIQSEENGIVEFRPDEDEFECDSGRDGQGIDALRIESGPRPTEDIQAILHVLGRRVPTHGTKNHRPLDLSKTDLRGASFARSPFNEANYQTLYCRTTRFRGVEFSGADLRDSLFHLSDLRDTRFEGANLSGVILDGSDVQGANFEGAEGLTPDAVKDAFNWILALYDKGLLRELGLPEDHNERLGSLELSEYDLREGAFQAPRMHLMNLRGADLSEALLQNADLSWTDLRESILCQATLDGADLEIAKLQGANLREASLSGAKLRKANLLRADMRDVMGLEPDQVFQAWNWIFAHFDKDFLEELGLPPDHNDKVAANDFSRYKLSGFDLSGTQFPSVSLAAADLAGANLAEVHFGGSDLTGANLKDADLSSADLSLAKGLTQEQINQAKGDEDTELPPHLGSPDTWPKEEQVNGEEMG